MLEQSIVLNISTDSHQEGENTIKKEEEEEEGGGGWG